MTEEGSRLPLRLCIEYIAPSTLKANPLNPRVHPPRQIKALCRSIREHGFAVPVLIDREGRLIAGHARIEAALKVGLSEVPVVQLDQLSEAQARSLMIADNQLTDMSRWDPDLLAQNFRLLAVEGLDLDLEATGFSMGEIDLILDPATTVPEDDPDDAPMAPGVGPPVNQVGDQWRLGKDGRHHLGCDSALDPAVWKELLAGEKAMMSISDVPYNVRIAGNVSGLGRIRHGEFVMASGEMHTDEYEEFLAVAFRNLVAHSESGSLHYAFIDWKHLGEMQTAGDRVFTELKNVCVWDKGRGGMGSLYRSAHEFVFVWKAGKGRHRNNVELGRHGRNRTNVWSYPGIGTFRHSDEGDLLALHPTVKPVRLIADAILDVTARGDIVLDAFLGSGTTIIAAERVGRRCFGVELDPAYADVAIRRFERHSGEEAVHVASGRAFAEIASDRAAETGVGEADHG